MSIIGNTFSRSLRTSASHCTRRTLTPPTTTALTHAPTFRPSGHVAPPRTFSTSTMSSSAAPYKVVSTPDAPSAVGPYVQATVHNGIIYCSGCIPFDPKTMTLVEGGIEVQAQRAIDNLFAVLKEAGGDKSTVLKTTVFLADMGDFAKVNVVYEKNFAPYKPARSAVAVRELPKSVGFEIEAIAAVKA